MSGGLTRRTESLLRALRTRHGRRDSEYCFCDGLRASREVVTLAPELVELVILREGTALPFSAPVEPVVLPQAEFDRIAPTVHSQGILVLSRRPAPVPMDVPMADPFALVLDRVGDPGNFGTILRTARAVGLHEVWLTRGTADPFSDKVVRSASGASARAPCGGSAQRARGTSHSLQNAQASSDSPAAPSRKSATDTTS